MDGQLRLGRRSKVGRPRYFSFCPPHLPGTRAEALPANRARGRRWRLHRVLAGRGRRYAAASLTCAPARAPSRRPARAAHKAHPAGARAGRPAASARPRPEAAAAAAAAAASGSGSGGARGPARPPAACRRPARFLAPAPPPPLPAAPAPPPAGPAPHLGIGGGHGPGPQRGPAPPARHRPARASRPRVGAGPIARVCACACPCACALGARPVRRLRTGTKREAPQAPACGGRNRNAHPRDRRPGAGVPARRSRSSGWGAESLSRCLAGKPPVGSPRCERELWFRQVPVEVGVPRLGLEVCPERWGCPVRCLAGSGSG
ncbi:hypothetical protein P7K49_002254 [Saguinus oedipus]|uniref:Uncharacterized protein n=1 Tax=Saguinus oedipus TaxID=9490 RepID=A0ABQ9WGT5_SAGOE|nr:hypothetical protein P7K49_002254 [Saguinus oedipus]